MFYKFLVAWILICFMINFNFKYVLYTCIPKNITKLMIFRILVSYLNNFSFLYCVQKLPILLTTLVQNSSPMFTILMARLILKEHIMMAEIFCMIMAFGGMVVLFSDISEESESSYSALAIFLLILVPVTLGYTNIMMRQLNMLHEFTYAFYSQLAFFVISGIVSLIFTDSKL